MLLIILVDELQYPVQSFLILRSHISTSVSMWDFKSHNAIILRQKNAIGLQKSKTRWRFCSSPHIIVFCYQFMPVQILGVLRLASPGMIHMKEKAIPVGTAFDLC